MVHVPEGTRHLLEPDRRGEPAPVVPPACPEAQCRCRARTGLHLFPVLSDRTGQIAGTLSGGQQRILALARVLATPPRLLIVDELSLGLAPAIVDSVYEALVAIRKTGCAVLVVEQQVDRALAIADQAVLLARGRVAWTGPPSDAANAMESVLGGRLISAAAADAADSGTEANQLPADDPDGNAQFEDGRPDVGPDAGTDAGTDAGPDAGTDAESGGGNDAGNDGPTEEEAGKQGVQATTGARKEGT